MSRREPGSTGRGRRRLTATEIDLSVVQQRALLVGTGFGARSVEAAEESLAELALLTETAGADPVHVTLQRRTTPDPATYVGKGKAEELRELSESLDIDVVVFDDELTPAQQRNLERPLRARRRRPRRAHPRHLRPARDEPGGHGAGRARAAPLPVAATARPRQRSSASRARASAPEVPARRSSRSTAAASCAASNNSNAISKTLAKTRDTQRKARVRSGVARIALVGYTNAGKSTLLNRLTHSDALVEDQLFSTLDPTTRRLRLPGGETVLVSDTVGFVQRLPHQLVEAFKSTLEEVVDADLLLHVVDASRPDVDGHIAAVDAVLHEIGAGGRPNMMVWNKRDIAAFPKTSIISSSSSRGSVAVSGATGDGVDELAPHDRGSAPRARPSRRARRSVRPRRRACRAAPRRRRVGRGARRGRDPRARPAP